MIRDILPSEVTARREILQKILRVLEQAGYAEIVTPTFEEYASLSVGLPEHLKGAAYRFFDHKGVQMILRPDITTQIARVAATKLRGQKGPLRFYYSGDVYRTSGLEIGQNHQFHQIGVELFDVSGARGDREVLNLAENVLRSIGLQNYNIARTDAGKIRRLPPKQREALRRQDFVTLHRLPCLPELLSVDLEYYTGLYFECFVPEMGYILGSGGRYDNLCSTFGRKRSAVGFAFNLDKLVQAVQRRN